MNLQINSFLKYIPAFFLFILVVVFLVIGLSLVYGNCQNSKYNYIFQHYYLKLECVYDKSKNKNGVWKGWHKNGQLAFEETWSNGFLDGNRKAWYSNGQILWIQNFNMGVENKESIGWHYNGKKSSEVYFLNGQRHGLCRTWYDNNKIQSEERFDNGRPIEISRFYWKNGNLKREIVYSNYIMKAITEWHKNGEKKSEKLY